MVDAVRRVAREQVDGALALVEDDGDVGKRIHEIRKGMKKLRGLIRLVRPGFPDYEIENAHFRDTARSISGPRDAAVIVATFDRLIDTYKEPLDKEAFTAFRSELAKDNDGAPDLAHVAEALRLARGRIDFWTLSETGWDAVAGGLGKTYRRARRLRKAKTDHQIHEWRKRVKYHWYHMRLLAEIWPEGMVAREEAADAMGEHLGLHQDLSLLEDRIGTAALSPESRRVLRGLIGRHKAEAAAAARELAPKVLADKPKALVTRWGELWEAWRG